MRALLLTLAVVAASVLAPAWEPGAEAGRSVAGSVTATLGHLLEAVPGEPTPISQHAWTNGRSNVQALWAFAPRIASPSGRGPGPEVPGDALLMDQGGTAFTAWEVRTARDLTLEALEWTSHPACHGSGYRGTFIVATRDPVGMPLAPRVFHYEVCGDEIFVAPGTDMLLADRALLATTAVRGPEASAEAYEIVIEGNAYAFIGAPTSAGTILRQGRLVPLEATPVAISARTLDLDGLRPRVGVDLHDVVDAAAPRVAAKRAFPLFEGLLTNLRAMLHASLP